jgi:hypothetical protein
MSKELKVCPKCGWYDHGQLFRTDECDPDRGKIADELAAKARAAGVSPTKLGYGFGNITIEVDERTHLQLEVNRNGTFDVRDLYMLDDLDPDDVMAIVETVKRIREKAVAS